MKTVNLILAFGLVSNLVIGCGGSGTGIGGAKLSKYKKLLNHALAGKPIGHSGQFAKLKKMQKRTPIGRTSLGVGSIYFDDDTQLWVRVDVYDVETDEFGATFLRHWDYAFFQDQALTQPAGRSYYREFSDNGKNVLETAVDYLAGPQTSYHVYQKHIGDPVSLDTEDFLEIRQVGNAYLDKSHVTWSEANAIQTAIGDTLYDNGNFEHTTGTWARNGNVTFSYSDNSGYSTSMNWSPDGSGGFTLANSTDPELPANATWTPGGTGTATFADGTSIPFNLTEDGFNFG